MRFLSLILCLFPLAAQAGVEEDFLALNEAFRKGDEARVEQLAPRFANSELEPYARYYQLRLGWNRRDKHAEIKAFLARPADTPLIGQLRNEWLKRLASEQRWTQFAELASSLDNPDTELACYLLQYRRVQQGPAVLREVRKRWFSDKALPESCEPLFDEAILRGIIDRQDIWSRIRLALESGKVSFAKQLATRLPVKYRSSLWGLDAAARDPARYLDRLKLNRPGAGQRLVILFALQRLARQSPGQAHEYWKRLEANFPQDERQYFYGWLGYAAARALDERALDWYREADEAVLNAQQLAWRARAALRAGDWHEVWVSISSMDAAQQNEPAWRYWKGRALQALGRPAAAEMLFTDLSREYHFYGQLAAEELGAAPADGVLGVGVQPSLDELEAVGQLPGIRRSITLYRLGLRVEAAREWAFQVAHMNDRQLLAAAELAQRNEMYDRAIYAAEQTRTLHNFELRYPAPYRDNLHRHLREFGLEEAWVYGLMRQESRFVTQARSSAGAAGLMQVMPTTARWVAKKLNMRDYRSELIHQLDVNLRLGTFYLRNVFAAFDENPVLASAAYNAGPTRARQWRAARPLEGAVYIETIPFDETRDYVKKVMSNTMYYAKLFGQPVTSLKLRLGTVAARTAENQKASLDER